MAPRPVVIRTIDLGGDKLAHVLDTTPEANPFLGWRGIRISLDTPEMFKTQLRAVLRAGAKGEVQILLPMISSLDEIRRARVLLEETKTELRASGQPFQKQCKLGVMVEVPAVALMADQFAREADFFSLGTNDLVQYTLAVDRGASRVADLYDPFHPAVLRLIRMVADSGRQRGIPVSICGEMAGDPRATGLLLGLGLEQLSTNPGLLPQIKEAVRSVDLARSRQVAAHCVELDTGAAVRRYLEQEMPAGEP
jgi:phosphotransferase system enzyme I (PtsI)